MKFAEIRIDHIVVGDRLRKVDVAAAQRIAHSVEIHGLLQPIVVFRDGLHYVLKAGAHRVEAFRILKRETIQAHVFDTTGRSREYATKLGQLIEINENMQRKGLTQGEVDEHRVRGVQLAADLVALETREKAEADLKAARRAAEAARKADDAKALKTAENARTNAAHKIARLDKERDENPVDNGKNVTEVPKRLKKAAERYARDFGGSPRTVVDSVQRWAALGEETNKLIRGTSLDSQTERNALVTLQGEFPEAAKALLRRVKAIPDGRHSASGELGNARRERNAEARDKAKRDARTDETKAWGEVVDVLNKVIAEMRSGRPEITPLALVRNKVLPEFDRGLEIFEALRTKALQGRDIVKPAGKKLKADPVVPTEKPEKKHKIVRAKK